MTSRSPHWQLLPWIALTTLIAFMVVAMASRFVELRTLTNEAVRVDVAKELDHQVQQWSQTQHAQLTRWSELLLSSPLEATDLTAKKMVPSVDAVFRWKRGADGAITLVTPGTTSIQEKEITATCLEKARNYSFNRSADVSGQVSAYINGCTNERVSIQLEAIDIATNLWINAGRPLLAITLLQQNLPTEASSDQLKLLELQYLHASLMVTHNVEGGLQRLLDVGELVAEEPKAIAFIKTIHIPTLAMLRKAGWVDEAQDLDQKFGKYQRLRNAQESLPAQLKTTPETGFFCPTLSCTSPLFLFEKANVGIALAIDRNEIGNNLLSRLSKFNEAAAIIDATGVVLLGNRQTSPIHVKRSLHPTLANLSLGVRDSALVTQTKHIDDQLTILLVLGLTCLLLALLGISAQYRANKRLHKLLARQAEFTRRSAHELRTPLAVVSLLAENLADGLYNDNSTPEVAGQIIDETSRLTSRVDELLRFSRPSNSALKTLFDPEEAILDTLLQWAPRYKNANIKLSVDCDGTGKVFGDHLALRDAVSALLDNAYKYIDPSKNAPSVWLSLTQIGMDVVLEVVDNGLGVPKEMRVDIFEQFVRIEGDHRGTSGGYGLGLAQVQRTVSMHNGTISCTEGIEGGARFTITLPISPETNT